MGHAVISI